VFEQRYRASASSERRVSDEAIQRTILVLQYLQAFCLGELQRAVPAVPFAHQPWTVFVEMP
jgi:hypothetical protein